MQTMERPLSWIFFFDIEARRFIQLERKEQKKKLKQEALNPERKYISCMDQSHPSVKKIFQKNIQNMGWHETEFVMSAEQPFE